MKERTAAKLGIRSETTVLPEDTPEAELLELLEKLNADDSVHGVLVQRRCRGTSTRPRFSQRYRPERHRRISPGERRQTDAG